MKKFLFLKWQDTKLWYSHHERKIKYHVRSIIESFIAGFLAALIAELQSGKLEGISIEVIWGVFFVAVRSGVKLIKVPILGLLTYLLKLVKRTVK